MATASPCRSRNSVIASILWADQCPKSSGRASSDSNGSPPSVMCRRCHSAPIWINGRAADRSRWRIRGATLAEGLEQRRLLQQRDFDGLGKAADEVSIGEGRKERRVIDHRPGDGECAEPVLLAEEIDPVLDADAGVGLGQRGGREPDQAQAAMRDRRREADRVEHRASADHHDVRASVQVGRVEDLEHALQDVDIVLDRLAAHDDLNVTRVFDSSGVPRRERADLGFEVGLRLGDVLVEPELHPRWPVLRRFEHLREDVLIVA